MNENNNTELTQEDLEMGKYIFSILKCQKVYLMSWGFNSPVVVKLGLQFNVNGFKHKGLVQVVYNEGADLFDIYLIDNENQKKEIIEGIYFDELTETIDNHVERVNNYNERVNQEYNIINYDKETN